MRPSIVWFRQDLRLEDHPALTAAIQRGGAVIPIYIWAPEEEQEWMPGGASRWWLHYSLLSLQEELSQLKSKLIIRQGFTLQTLLDLIQETGADTVFWNRCYEPKAMQRDAFIKLELQKQGVRTQWFNGRLLFEPWSVVNRQNRPFQTFNFFWKQCLSLGEIAPPLPSPKKIKSYIGEIDSDPLLNVHLLPKVHWDTGLAQSWTPGIRGAKKRLNYALENIIENYHLTRDRPDLDGVSRLSPYLHHGELSPRLVWHAVCQRFGLDQSGTATFLRQLGWREFAYYLLYHFPNSTYEPLRADFRSFPWRINYQTLKAWQNGHTGYPLVDAGMRQLWRTGWMHNRVRLVVASFLVKDLLIHWQEGARWFWDTLVDADLANNILGWQWVAGCGVDAAPYFRIFNPITQGNRFDETGNYIRQWIPELRALPTKWIHQPWKAPEEVLKEAGVVLGIDYPYPIINHEEARQQALEAYAKL